jgi:prepilin-type N-terminal cleavage/methylation domain-containing protein
VRVSNGRSRGGFGGGSVSQIMVASNGAHFQLRPKRNSGFTLAELLASAAILGLSAGAILWGLTILHAHATINRLYTQAQTLCQNQVDRVLTNGPYNQTATPTELTNQTATVQVSTAPGNPVSGTMTTTVLDTGLKYPAGTGTDLRIKQAKVVVAYKFRGKDYSVELNTMRAPDQ